MGTGHNDTEVTTSVRSPAPNKCVGTLFAASIVAFVCGSTALAVDGLPFEHKLTLYREKDSETIVFSLLLEQPFLAEQFERSNYLRLQPLDENAYLIYPKETRFEQKHAAFYGRLRGSGVAKVRLEYETVTENLDGSKRVQVQHGEIEIQIPAEEAGADSIFKEWARRQNDHFRQLLAYYPNETFLQYVLLQSEDRYGVKPPPLPKRAVSDRPVEEGLYQVVTGSLAIQQSLQQEVLKGAMSVGDQTIHISEFQPPAVKSPDYEKLLERKQEREGIVPQVSEVSRLIPADQYLLQFNAMKSAGELLDLTQGWGGSLLRIFHVHAKDNHLQEKFEQQLLVRRDALTRLFADAVIDGLAITGSDLYLSGGTDVTLILRLRQPELFETAAAAWGNAARARHADLVERSFNYRGQQIDVYYTPGREVSSFQMRHDDFAIYSNSHAAVRRIIDTIAGDVDALYEALDYQYVSTILPARDDAKSGYFYASEAFLKRQISPALKISEKRRKQCFNNLVMLNNASLFYRLEYGKSPDSLNTLIAGKFIDPQRLVCPHGGTYTYDPEDDAATCSLHNRLKYLTPNAELEVLRVSGTERDEYLRYKERFAAEWQPMFDPVAVRVHVDRAVRIESCVLPFANGGLYADLRDVIGPNARDRLAVPSAATSLAELGAVLTPERIGRFLRDVPAIPEVLAADPTLTDLSWLGERVSLHVCDADQIVQIEPQYLQPLNFFGEIGVMYQAAVGLAVTATTLPTYVAIEVRDAERAQRFLDLLTSKVFLQDRRVFVFDSEFDAYRLPDYQSYANYVLSFRLYAIKLRLHVALVGDRLVAATTLETLEQVIDAAEMQRPVARAALDASPERGADSGASGAGEPAHLVLRLKLGAMSAFLRDLRLYWAESSRRACHENIMSIHNLATLYDVPVSEVNRLAETKYGVTYFCPEGGEYSYDAGRDEVMCSLHGNRQHSRQESAPDGEESSWRFIENLREIEASLRYRDDALMTTIRIERKSVDQN